MDFAREEMRSNLASGAFKDKKAFTLAISDLRKQGITPQPYR